MQNQTQLSILDHSSPGSPVRGSYSSFKQKIRMVVLDVLTGWFAKGLLSFLFICCQVIALLDALAGSHVFLFVSQITALRDASVDSICIGSATPLFCCLLDDCYFWCLGSIMFPMCELSFVCGAGLTFLFWVCAAGIIFLLAIVQFP